MANHRVSPVYNVRETRKARSQLDAIAATNYEFARAWVGFCWLLERTPTTIGVLVAGKQTTYVVKTEDFLAIGMPTVVVTYSIVDADKMVLEIIEVVEVVQSPILTSSGAAAAS